MLMATFAIAACWQTWRTGHVRTGVLVALAAAVIGGALSGAGALLFVAIWHDPSTLRAIQNSGGLDEALWACLSSCCRLIGHRNGRCAGWASC